MCILKDLTGKRFGRLVVVKRYKNRILPSGRNQILWLCKCDCGNEHIASGENLKSGSIRSCGCYSREISSKAHKTHGMSCSRLFNIWESMKKRCFLKTHKSYKDYGGRGIKVCKEWMDRFEPFHNWAIANGYKDNLTLDRIDFNGNYEPSNCRWITIKEQQSNRRSNRFITYDGETLTLTQIAAKYNISRHTLAYRLNKGMDIKDALMIPIYKGNKFEVKQ